MRNHRKSRSFIIVLIAMSLLSPAIPQVQANPSGMEQVIFGGVSSPLDSTATEYNSLYGYIWDNTESDVYKLVSTDGVLKQLRFRLNGAPGAGKKYTFTLMVNGVPSALIVEVADAATSGSDMVNEVDVTGGDIVSLRCVPTGTPTAVRASWSSIFVGDTPNESLIMGGASTAFTRFNIEYTQVMCGSTSPNTPETDYRQVVPTSGTIKNFYVKLDIDPGDAPDAYRFTLRKNGVSQSLTITIIADDTTGSDLVNSFNVVAGDILTLMGEPLNAPAVSVPTCWGMTFVADINGESIILGGSADELPVSATEYNRFTSSEGTIWQADETLFYKIGQVCTLKKFYLLLASAPGGGNSYDFTIRIAGADSGLTIHIQDTDTTGNTGGTAETIANDEYLTIQVVPTSRPTIGGSYWGLVCYIEPPPLKPNIPSLVLIHFNTTIAGELCGIYAEFFDTEGLYGYIFWNNATSPPGGVNSSFTSMTGTSNSTQENVALPSSGNLFGARYYVNDTDGYWGRASTITFPTAAIGDGMINYPAIDRIEFNTTVAEEVCGVIGEFSDVESLSGYIFWENATSPPGGANSSWTSLTGTSDSALENITLPSNGTKLGVIYYVNDTDGNWGVDTLIIFPSIEIEAAVTNVFMGGAGIFWIIGIILIPIVAYMVKRG